MSKVSINESTLTSIGNAIRAKTGKSDLIAPLDMPDEISAIQTGGGADLPEEAFTVTGNCSYRFANGGWDWFIEQYGNRVVTNDITVANYMFSQTKVSNVPFTLNFPTSYSPSMGYFCADSALKAPPKIGEGKGPNPTSTQSAFSGCLYMQFPEDYGSEFNFSYIESASTYNGNQSNMFTNCRSMRKIPMNLINRSNPNIAATYNFCYNGFNGCYALDGIVDLPIPGSKATWTSNGFMNGFMSCGRLKALTFAKNADGSPVAVKWKNQTIELKNWIGYVGQASDITGYNSGLTEATRIIDDESYQALKNNPDSWTTNFDYSRYNHDSAVETINSLPDTSAYLATAGGTNTIAFNGLCGRKTDGGAINTLTEAEIAVAAAKGWTVSFG